MSSIIKTNKVQGLNKPQVLGADSHVVHEALATPDSGVLNVDHSLIQEPVRMRMVERVRALIAAGFYDREEFLEILVDEVIRREGV